MGFIGVYRAIYDYAPQGEGELDIKDGDLLFVLDKESDDDWWKAKKKAASEDEEEPEGLIPNNYVEEVSARRPLHALRGAARRLELSPSRHRCAPPANVCHPPLMTAAP